MPMVDMVKYYYIKYFICTVFNWVYVQKELESHHNINKAEFYLCFKQHPNVFWNRGRSRRLLLEAVSGLSVSQETSTWTYNLMLGNTFLMQFLPNAIKAPLLLAEQKSWWNLITLSLYITWPFNLAALRTLSLPL